MENLTPDSTLIFFLRNLFSQSADYAVYIPDSGDVIILTKEQLAFLIERGCGDAMIKTLPQLVKRNIIKPINIEEIDYPQDFRALYVETTGSFVNNLEVALSPDEPQFPEWWNAPVPFAISSRGVLRLNDTAKKLFGSGLEKLNSQELPERDEFIVRLEGTNGARFIAFRKLKPGIFTVDDCTDDLNDAQDITWWAAVGQAWVREIEAQGGKWQRLSEPPQGKTKGFRACEWNGELQGYLDIEMPKKNQANKKSHETEKIDEPEENEAKINAPELESQEPIQPEPMPELIQDDVIDKIGPQAMGLLAAGNQYQYI